MAAAGEADGDRCTEGFAALCPAAAEKGVTVCYGGRSRQTAFALAERVSPAFGCYVDLANPGGQRARPRDGAETARRVAAKTTPDKASSRCDMVGRASGGCITAPVRADDRRILPEAPDRAVDSEERLPDDLRNGEDARWAGLLPPVEQHSEAPD